MKRPILIFILFLFGFENTQAQFVTIPDPVFVSWLNISGYSGCMNGNQMDTTCSAIINATYINCSNLNITDLTGISYFDNLTSLICKENQLTFLPPLPATLNFLNCKINYISLLTDLPAALTNLDCGLNQLTTLPALPSSLTVLTCEFNYLNTLPSLPNTLTIINCWSNSLTALPTLPSSLTSLICYGNQLSSLPALPSSLTILNCFGNQLSSLPILPSSLTNLECNNNQLSSLPSLPSSLTLLGCANNQLSSIPSLPPTLTVLVCSENNLSVLPTLPSTLIELYCTQNNLTSLPPLPSSLLYLFCGYNQLAHISALNDSMIWIAINNNPGLTCLPPINFIRFFAWDSTAITCLPNFITNTGSSNPPISNIPICNYFNDHNCDIYWNIGGKIYNDSSANCIKDSIDPSFENVKINLYYNSNLIQQTYSNLIGQYAFDTDTATYTYAPDSNSIYNIICPISGIHTSSLTALDSIDNDMDFAIECKPGFDIGVTSILRSSGVFRPANFASVKILGGDLSNNFGLHCASGVNGEVKLLMSGPASFVSPLAGALTPTFSGDTLIYSIADFGTVDYHTSFGLYVQTDTTAQTLQQVCFEVWVTPSGDNDSTNNHLTQCFNVLNSYDPNDKTVSPEYIEDANGEWLTYTVRFQNTGNAPANHIYILDTLSQFVDAATFELITYSHEPLTVLTGNAIRFNFAGINLPDSVSNEPGSHGYVQYRVKSLSGLANNTAVENTAYIYFDFNAPVVTNTASSLVHCLESRSISQTICHGESFSFNNLNIQYPGVYLDTIYNTNGCDTIVYLNLNVTYQSINTIQNGNSLQVLNSGNYQWINCNTNTSIAGQTSNTFSPTANGNYAVVVSNGSCVDTSSCINFVISGVAEINSSTVKLSPNPAGEYILLENLPINKCQIIVHDITGRVESTLNNESSKQQLNVASLSKGVYLIEITGKDVYERLYFVKE